MARKIISVKVGIWYKMSTVGWTDVLMPACGKITKRTVLRWIASLREYSHELHKCTNLYITIETTDCWNGSFLYRIRISFILSFSYLLVRVFYCLPLRLLFSANSQSSFSSEIRNFFRIIISIFLPDIFSRDSTPRLSVRLSVSWSVDLSVTLLLFLSISFP